MISQPFKKIYYNFLCDAYVLRLAKLSFFEKLQYLLRKYSGIATSRLEILFKNKTYYYDNIFGSVVFQLFPFEIERLEKYVNFNEIDTVLDIGANTGQWIFALTSYFPGIRVHSFEPIPMAFERLKKNSQQFENWHVYNYAIGDVEGRGKIYYSPEGTTTGSFYKDKVEHNFKRNFIESKDVAILKIKRGNALGIPMQFDLVKIDVEGFEREVLNSLSEVTFKYAYIEVHKSEDSNGKDTEGICDILQSQGRKCRVIYSHTPAIAPGVIEVLFECQ